MKKLAYLIIVLIIITGCTEKNEEAEGKDRTDLKGHWEGEIEIPNQPLSILIDFQKGEEWTGSITIPAQNVTDFSLTDIEKREEKVSFKMPLPGQSVLFDGEFSDGKISGTFTQNGQSFPFSLKKGERKSEEDGEFLSIETSTGKLYGEVLIPEKNGPSPVALIIPGSGPTDRNGNSQGTGKNDSLKLLAESLAEKGIASLRYDKRGAGKNREAVVNQKEMRFEVFVDDAKQWLEILEEDDRFTDIAVIGHSQGSLVGMMAAGSETTEAFISLAGAGQTIDQVLENQLQDRLPKDLFEESQSILEKMRNGEVASDVSQPLQSVLAPDMQPFIISWMAYDPSEQFAALDVPSLIINGTHDIQVAVEEAHRLEEAEPEADLLLIDGMNHILKEAPEDREENLATYTNPDLPLADGVVDGIVDFLDQQGFQHER
ncbi:alpha/beta hydrolase [Halobacillus karajensis]|uniref:3-oxoadipate enol-lactonase n=1 Tax=Halobacillus karajensis TaxID=195088 RepID=A0A059NZ49_9BACI|nr:alpha/beta hydrolase [Halobacillus karajensis]CDQ18651.1 3-oxoadipate enol-lactonase [Halobacillus karajensis]CDQ23277.1 3-oxoadipate enol-lactonase [Halobacillus karajensis]CDQ26759.1 3-oxoadipate enol-lactonase [Halobacillus karajensis]